MGKHTVLVYHFPKSIQYAPSYTGPPLTYLYIFEGELWPTTQQHCIFASDKKFEDLGKVMTALRWSFFSNPHREYMTSPPVSHTLGIYQGAMIFVYKHSNVMTRSLFEWDIESQVEEFAKLAADNPISELWGTQQCLACGVEQEKVPTMDAFQWYKLWPSGGNGALDILKTISLERMEVEVDF